MEKYKTLFLILGIGMMFPITILNSFGDAMGIPTGVRHVVVPILLIIQVISATCLITIIRRDIKEARRKHEEFMKKFDDTVNQSKYN